MHQLTIRSIDPEVERQIRKIAQESRKSMNQVIKEILHKEFKGCAAPASSLRKLAGGWTQNEAAEFARLIQSCEQIDEEMWE